MTDKILQTDRSIFRTKTIEFRLELDCYVQNDDNTAIKDCIIFPPIGSYNFINDSKFLFRKQLKTYNQCTVSTSLNNIQSSHEIFYQVHLKYNIAVLDFFLNIC